MKPTDQLFDEEDFKHYAFLKAEIRHLGGSHTYGLNHEGSDEDVRGVFIAPDELKNNPFVDFRTDQVRFEDNGDDILLWEFSDFCKKLPGTPQCMDILYAPEDTYQKQPSRAMRLLINNREAFLSRLLVHALIGHGRRALVVARKSQSANKQKDLDKPCQLDYLYLDESHGLPLHKSIDVRKNSPDGDGFMLEKTVLSGAYRLYSAPGKKLLSNGHMAPVPKGEGRGDYIGVIHYDSLEFRKATIAYRNRMQAPDRHQKHLDRQHTFGFDTKAAATALRCFRMAQELTQGFGYQVRRPDAEELKSIILEGSRSLGDIAAEMTAIKDEVYSGLSSSSLPERPDYQQLSQLYIQAMRMDQGPRVAALNNPQTP